MISARLTIQPDALADFDAEVARQKRALKPHEATIGLHDEDGGKAKVWYDGRDQIETLAEIMILHEYGDAGLPERSFLRSWFDRHLSQLQQGMFDAMKAEVEGNSEALKEWVTRVHREWRDWIAGGPFVPLSPRTIQTKAQFGLPQPETPLTATKQFIEAWRAKLDGMAL